MMKRNEIQLSYRKSAVEGASPIGLVIALYDTMSGDLRRAAAALRKDDIETRCAALNHAAIVLGQLEDWVATAEGGELAQNLKAFYAHLRMKFLEAGITRSAAVLEAQVELILQVRGAWQERDQASVRGAVVQELAAEQQTVTMMSPMVQRASFSQSA